MTHVCSQPLMKMLNVISTHGANDSQCMTHTTEVVPLNKVSMSPINSMDITQQVLDNTQMHQVSETTPAKQMCMTPPGHHESHC